MTKGRAATGVVQRGVSQEKRRRILGEREKVGWMCFLPPWEEARGMKGERKLKPPPPTPTKSQVKDEQRVGGQDGWSDMYAERR